MQFTEQEFLQLMNNVTNEFAVELAKAEEDFKAKSKEDSEASDSGKPEEKVQSQEQKEEPKFEEKPSDEAPEQKEEGEVKPAAESAAPVEDKAPEAPVDDESHDYDNEDMEHMQKMYSSMKKGELKAHHDAVRKALDECGMGKCGESAPMAKSEVETVIVPDIKVVEENSLLKSELESEKTKHEELKKNFEAMSAFITKLVEKKTAPPAKAFTSLEAIAKSESTNDDSSELSEGQINSILSQKIKGDLTKSERQAINTYFLGNKDLTKISHLLKQKA